MKAKVCKIQVIGVLFILLVGIIANLAIHHTIGSGMLLFVVIAGIFVFFVHALMKNSLSGRVHEILESKAQTQEPQRSLFLRESDIVVQIGSEKECMEYSLLHDIVMHKEHLFLLTITKDVLIVPFSAFESQDDIQNFYQLLQRKRGVL